MLCSTWSVLAVLITMVKLFYLCIISIKTHVTVSIQAFLETLRLWTERYLNMLRRLVAFNLGYLPGGDKEIITRSETTLLALEAAKRILIPGGLISIVVYVGHPGGRWYFLFSSFWGEQVCYYLFYQNNTSLYCKTS